MASPHCASLNDKLECMISCITCKDKEGYQQDFMKRGANHKTSLIFRYFVF